MQMSPAKRCLRKVYQTTVATRRLFSSLFVASAVVRQQTWILLHLFFFLHFFLTCLLPYLSFPSRMDPLRFQAGCRKRRQNLALVFCGLFCVVVHFFWLVNACFCRVRFSFFPYQVKRGGFEKRLRNDLFCVERDVKARLSRSIIVRYCSESSWRRYRKTKTNQSTLHIG